MFKKFSRESARAAQATSLIAAATLLAACASKPAPATASGSGQPSATPPTTTAAATQSLEQYLQDGAKAAAEGNDKERSREIYRTAARMYPASKLPWVKLAEDYFEAAQYGQAILAAQEVVQRDPDDGIATSILAVSGLRVSVSALAALRDQNGKLSGGTRSEAQTLARLLRDSIGESELVPQPAANGTAPNPQATTAKPTPAARPRPIAVRRPATPVAAAAATPAPAAAAPASADDPFKILKK